MPAVSLGPVMSLLGKTIRPRIKRELYTKYSETTPGHWLQDKLKEGAKWIKIAAGELRLCFRGKVEEVAEMAKAAILQDDVHFTVICGPEIFATDNDDENASGKSNALFSLIDDERLKSHLELFVTRERLPFHYIITDIDGTVLIEKAHLRSAEGAPFYTVKDIEIIYPELLHLFEDQKRGGVRIKSTKEARDIPWLKFMTLEELRKEDKIQYGGHAYIPPVARK